MPYHDLNLPYSSAISSAVVSHNISFAKELGYTVVALSTSIDGKLPAKLPTIPITDIIKPTNVTLLTRLTLTVSDTSQNHRLSNLSSPYSLLALRPTNENSFQLCCGSLECDLISIDFSQRLPFILKFKTVSSALQRGVRFEICYSAGVVGGVDARRNVISGATQLIRATRGKGIILSSEAKSALGLRAPHDVMNLLQIWGLGQERGKETVCEEADRVVRLARLRRESYRGLITVVNGGGPSQQEIEAQKAREIEAMTASEGNADVNKSNGVKRKALDTSLSPLGSAPADGDKPLSKKEQKRRAKKARFEAQSKDANPKPKTKLGTNNSFPIKHEALLSAAPHISKKS
jgi:ribonuclease P/MRP protein subunit RPP1